MLSCWWHMRLARAGTLLRVLTPLSSIPRNSYRFSIGPRTDQCLLYINTILTIENCLMYFFFSPSGQLVIQKQHLIDSWFFCNDLLQCSCKWRAAFQRNRKTLSHLFGFYPWPFFSSGCRMVSAKSPISAHRMLSLTDRALLVLSCICLYFTSLYLELPASVYFPVWFSETNLFCFFCCCYFLSY